jgi:hypothetical protein
LLTVLGPGFLPGVPGFLTVRVPGLLPARAGFVAGAW